MVVIATEKTSPASPQFHHPANGARIISDIQAGSTKVAITSAWVGRRKAMQAAKEVKQRKCRADSPFFFPWIRVQKMVPVAKEMEMVLAMKGHQDSKGMSP